MTLYQGNTRKMSVSTDSNNVAQYSLPIGVNEINMNALIGQSLKVVYGGEIHCVHCATKTKKALIRDTAIVA
ncbi:hypothetical protein C427_1229 [Paraglaciecola psychrophila 170]|uniref:Uncharacterized protein n=1 Tax=Paraglaciecola psychrophila 170 TaxID=1129794 RepID=M4RL64_9ALTE|nr:hypothetical protein C427_1229 [Paraglaciecola psychrophila 170]